MVKKIILLVMMAASFLLYGELAMSIDENRFLDENGNTILEINYEIPYKSLVFTPVDYGFAADVLVNITLFRDSVTVYQQDFTNRIVLTNQELTLSEGSFLDKIILTLSQPGFVISLVFSEQVTYQQKMWEYNFQPLSEDSMLSDLEFLENILPDSAVSKPKFNRNGNYYQVNPDHIFMIPEFSEFSLYFELSNFFQNEWSLSDLDLIFTILRGDEHLKEWQYNLQKEEIPIRITERVDLEALDEGLYNLHLEVRDNISGYRESRLDFFSLYREYQNTTRLFPDLTEELKLIRYFLPSSKTTVWTSLSDQGKQNFINQFWSRQDPTPTTEKNEFLDEVKQRIDYCNSFFSHYEEGWKTDRGRIYIRHGKPDEIVKQKTGFYTKYATKDYEIWKYRMGRSFTYIFIDLLTSGNYKLIYSENDDQEVTLPDWSSYLDSDFDESLLE